MSRQQNQSSFLTLSMEVSYPFHSYISSRNSQLGLNDQVRSSIHFPTSNLIAGQPKSNEVVVLGPISDIEIVRQRIRRVVPVEFLVKCRHDRVKYIGESSLIDYFSSAFGVLVRFYPKFDGVNCLVSIGGQHHRIEQLKKAVIRFCSVTRTILDHVAINIETSLDHARFCYRLLDRIVNISGAFICLPDLSICNIQQDKEDSIWIHGTMDSAYLASVLLTGLSPLQLVLEISSKQKISDLMAAAGDADILFQAESSTLKGYLTVWMTSFEKNVDRMYELACECLNLPKSSAVVAALPSQWTDFKTENCFLPASHWYVKEKELSIENSSSLFPVLSPSVERFDPYSFLLLKFVLKAIGLDQYCDLFLSNDVDLKMFCELNHHDLISIGVQSFQARKMMLDVTQELLR